MTEHLFPTVGGAYRVVNGKLIEDKPVEAKSPTPSPLTTQNQTNTVAAIEAAAQQK